MGSTIDRNELYAMIKRGDTLVLVETLPADVYTQGHLPNAINLPFEQPEEIAQHARAVLPDKHAAIVVYCMSHI